MPTNAGLVGFHWAFFHDGFALRLAPVACVRSPVSLYHTVISHQVGSCDLRYGFNMFSAVALLRKIGSTFLHIHPLGTRTMRRPQWDSSCEVVPVMVVTVPSMLLFILIFRITFFVMFLLF